MANALLSGIEVAEGWKRWNGESQWYKTMMEFGKLGGMVQWYCGFPQSASATPLCFALFDPDGNKLHSHSKLKDIKAAILKIKHG